MVLEICRFLVTVRRKFPPFAKLARYETSIELSPPESSTQNPAPTSPPTCYTDNGWFLTTPHCGHPVYQPAAKHRSLSPVCVSNLLEVPTHQLDRKSTRLSSSHANISY